MVQPLPSSHCTPSLPAPAQGLSPEMMVNEKLAVLPLLSVTTTVTSVVGGIGDPPVKVIVLLLASPALLCPLSELTLPVGSDQP